MAVFGSLRFPRAAAPALLLVLAGGCGGAWINEQHLDDGLTIVLPGIDGQTLASGNLCQTLAGLNLPTAIELYDWTVPGGTLVNQCAAGRNHAVAAALADHIADYRRRHPHRPVYLIGHSGGTAIAVWAAEALPPGEKLDAVILLGSSLSPGYDLGPALAATNWLVNYYSADDAVLLGAGCSAIGTMDRQFTQAAGMVGFSTTHPRLTQLPHDATMTAAGHDGSHFSYCGTPFITTYLAPRRSWSGERPSPGQIHRGPWPWRRSEAIADCQLPIADWGRRNTGNPPRSPLLLFNRQSEIGNRQFLLWRDKLIFRLPRPLGQQLPMPFDFIGVPR
ncbi:MAG: alpha/beta fold hydrolase [Planctomycetota bacterium]|nr:alpha/beta fold hydrolase [Planctomycetota bacterium]